MGDWLLYGVGFMAQLLFSARLITQWLKSEKSKKVETPTLFWKLSLLGSLLLFIYGYLRDDLAIMIGQFITYGVYWRNLRIQGEWKERNIVFKIVTSIIPFILVGYVVFFGNLQWSDLVEGENLSTWLIILGIGGQIIYTSRFLYQWYYSEKHNESTLPKKFWILSLVGSTLLFTYGIFRKDPVLIAAHAFGAIIYIRNLYLIKSCQSNEEYPNELC